MRIVLLSVCMLLAATLLSSCISSQLDLPPSTSLEPTVIQTEPFSTETPCTLETVPVETTCPVPPPTEDAFVLVADYIPDIVIDLKYATEDNFTGQVVYDFQDAYLRYGTVCKLMLVQEELRSLGYGLKLWDGFRPPKAQYALWEICPDPTYVSNPNNGFSNHSRGDTVDVTLVDHQGREVPMPTAFDDFSKLADRDYSDCPQQLAENAMLLEHVMEKHGFTGYAGEWWHFTDDDDYSVEMDFLSK